MAASLCRRSLLCYKNSLFQIQKRTGYIVLIPETPKEAADFNACSLESLPDFSNCNAKSCTVVLNQHAQKFEIGSWEINEHLEKLFKETENVDIFKNVIEPLEVLTIPFLASWGVTRTLYLASRSLMPIKTFNSLNDKVLQIRNHKFGKENFYIACKKYLQFNGDNCTEEQSRVVNKFILEGFHNGFELNEKNKAKLALNNRSLDYLKRQYEVKYLNSINLFKQVIMEKDFKNIVPADLLRNSAHKRKIEEGPWVITLQEAVYHRYMEYCSSREARRHTWISYNQLCSNFLNVSCNATAHFSDICSKRQAIAEILGFPSYAHLSMKTKMADSVERVQMVLSRLLECARFGQEREVYELEKFAYNNDFEGSLELWDLPYWMRKSWENLIGLQEDKLKEYFPMGQVLLGLIALCEQLFGIEIEEITEVDCWAPGVQYFRILDEKTKKILGGFYFDPYDRPDKSAGETDTGWFVPIRPRSKVIASLPLSSLIFSFTPPSDDQPSLLYYREVQNLFGKFGKMLQFTLTDMYYSEVSGLSNIEWDALDISDYFMKFWLCEKGTLESISGHYETGEPLPSQALEGLCNSHKHMAGTRLCKDIYYSNLDLYMHLRTEDVMTLVRDLWPQHFLFTLHSNDVHPFGFKQVIISPFASAIYSKVWSKMVAADIFWSFIEAGFSNIEEISGLGKKFRSTFLSLGGGCHPAEIFRRFQGRDPDPKFLINLLDLPTKAYLDQSSEPHLSLPETSGQ